MNRHPGPSRRTVLLTGASLLALPARGRAGLPATKHERFMAASRRLIQHRLSPGVGARLSDLLRREVPTLDADLDTILRVADQKGGGTVEEFFPDLPAGTAVETAHRIIFGWYAGVIDDSPRAEVFAYEEALMYQPTRDAVAIQTYGFDGPDHWTQVDPPLSAMPEF